MSNAIAKIQDSFKKHGLKLTKHRNAVAQVLAKANKPLGVKEIYAQLVKKDLKIGMATIYRVMPVLEQVGIVHRQPNVNGSTAYYQMPNASSGQVVCSRCGKVEQIEELPEFDNLRKKVSKNSKFATPDQSLYIIADCRNEKCE